MTIDELREIETRLTVALPEVYARTLLEGVSVASCDLNGIDSSRFFFQDLKSLLIENLTRRMLPQLGGNSWPNNYVCVGSNGAGDCYFVDANHEGCAIQIFNYETGAVEPIAADLPSFFQYLDELFRQYEANANESQLRFPDRAAPISPPSCEAIIARTNNPYESVIQPITMSEWRFIVSADAELEMQGYRIRTNPFTGGSMRINVPGLTVFKDGRTADSFEYELGRIIVKRPSQTAIRKLHSMANALNAIVIRINSEDP